MIRAEVGMVGVKYINYIKLENIEKLGTLYIT